MWTFAGGGEDQASLVDYIVRSSRGAVSSRAAAAMKRVDRKHFIGPLPESRANIYLVGERKRKGKIERNGRKTRRQMRAFAFALL